MRHKIILDTLTDIANFVVAIETATNKNDKIYVTDGDRMCVNAKSFLGLVHAREFDKIYVESEKDIYRAIYPFLACEIKEGNSHE